MQPLLARFRDMRNVTVRSVCGWTDPEVVRGIVTTAGAAHVSG